MMKTVVHIALALAFAAGSAYADSLALVQADASGFVSGTQAAFQATGKFTTVDIVDARFSTPTLATLSSYTHVLAWTNLFPADGTTLGNVLADYYDLGGKHLTIATYALTNPGGISGRIATGAYAALTDTGNFANPSGSLVPVVPGDVVFSGINLSALTYYHDAGFANAALAPGATLLATDGAGIDMIARSSNGVVDMNLYPGLGAGFGGVDNNDVFYNLVVNTFSTPSKALPVCGTSLSAAGAINQIQLSWNLAGVDHYNLYRGTASGGPYTLIGFANATASTYTDTAVLGGTTYYYIMREATATNTETCQSNEAKATDAVDKTPPTTTPSALPPANGLGWNNSNVTITLNAVDNPGGSGVNQISIMLTGAQTLPKPMTVTGSTASVTINTEGSTTVTYFATDNAGNAEASKTLLIMLDKTPPVATATASPAPNADGWNDTNVTVSFTGSDRLSGVASCTPSMTFTNNGAGQLAKGACADNAGNVGAPVSQVININKTMPVISGIPAPGKCDLWPPDDKMRRVAVLSVTGADTFYVTGTSNEPPDPGQTDIVITGTSQRRMVELRAKRSGNGGARIYTLKATATTWAGKTVVGSFTCQVAHDQHPDKDETGDR